MSEKIKMGIISDTHGLLREEVKERLKDCTSMQEMWTGRKYWMSCVLWDSCMWCAATMTDTGRRI
mgnify:CR=1 FL=1